MTDRVYIDYISDICESLVKCLEFTDGMDYEQFAEDDKASFIENKRV